MASQQEHNLNVISLDELVKNYLIDVGAPNNAKYNQYFVWAGRAVDELNWDVMRKFKQVYLVVDPTTKSAKLPSDMIQYVTVGLRNQVNEIISLAYDPSLVVGDIEQPEQEACCSDCGCDKEICYAVSNTTLKETEVTIPTARTQCTYTVVILDTHIRTGLSPIITYPYTISQVVSAGFTTIFSPVLTINNVNDYNTFYSQYIIPYQPYTVATSLGTFAYTTVTYASDYPASIVSYTKNGITTTVNHVVTNDADVEAYMNSLGWTLNVLAPQKNTFTITTYDVWSGFSYSGNKLAAQPITVAPSSCSTITEDVSYTNYCKTCTTSESTIVKECCNYGVNYSTTECEYSIELPDTRDGGFTFPLTDGIITIDGVDTAIPSCDAITDFISYMEGIGFYVSSYDPLTFYKYDSPIVYGSISSALQSLSYNFTQANCFNPVQQICTTTKICDIETEECGCPVLTNEVVNTMYSAGILNNTMFERYIHGGEIGTTWRQPWNRYGFYNIDIHKGIIQFDPFYQFDTVVLEYIAKEYVDSKDYLVPLLARDYILAYIRKCEVQRKPNTPLYEREDARKVCRAEKRNLMQRLNPIRYAEFKQIMDTTPKP